MAKGIFIFALVLVVSAYLSVLMNSNSNNNTSSSEGKDAAAAASLPKSDLIQEYRDYKARRIPKIKEFINAQQYKNPGHFSFREIKSRSRNPVVNCAIFHIAKELQGMRKKLSHRMVLNSAYRNPAHNHRVGGARNSQHIYGLAADIKVEDFDGNGRINYRDKQRLEDIALKQGATWIKRYKTHVHVDWR